MIGIVLYFYLNNSKNNSNSESELKYLVPESNDMIIHYKFGLNDISNNKVANYAFKNPVYDLVLNNNPIIQNNTFIKGNSSFYLNGNNQYATISPIKFSQNGVTILMWFKYAPSNEYLRTLFYISKDNLNYFNMSTDSGLNTSHGKDFNSARATSFSLKKNYTDNNWHHLALTMTYSALESSSSQLNIYIDNNLEISRSGVAYPDTSVIFNKNYIGNTLVLHNYKTPTGYINNFRMYNRVLSSSEITSIYNEY
jgi:hypothetical protein